MLVPKKYINPTTLHEIKAILALIFMLLTSLNSSSQQFREISLQSGLSAAANNNGVAVADYDNDHDLDVFVVTRWDGKGPTSSLLFRNNNDGTFSDVTTQSGINSTHNYSQITVESPHPTGEKMGVSWGDFNNDGFADLFLTNAYFLELYENNQDGTFNNVTSQMGLPVENECINDVGLWFDYNNDSFLDLYVTGVITVSSCRGKLYRNDGGTGFTEVSASVGLKDSGRSGWTAIPLDINSDGYQDMYIANDFGASNELFINQEGNYFVDQAEAYRVTDLFRDGMGVAYADYNGDGLFDLFVTNINESSLFRNSGDGLFNNVASANGVELTGWAWGCQFEDFDHDLDVDLVVANGYYDSDVDRYYENALETGMSTFLDHSEETGFGQEAISNGLVCFDYDNDGDLDVLIGRTGSTLGFFENTTILLGDEPGSNWLQVDLEGTTSNRDAIGTKLTLNVGEKKQVRYYHGAALMSQSQMPVHFGLSDEDTIDLLTITWPSGLQESFDHLPINAHISITEGSGFEVLRLSNNKVNGCTDPNSCNYDPEATFNDGTCEYLTTQTISGNPNPGLLSLERYTYPEQAGNRYHWEVTNGQILEGDGTHSVLVKWEIQESGQLRVTEAGQCFSAEASLDITLTKEFVPENVSVARLWMEALLGAIRRDFARPTVHARNLFHTSVAMYDAWAIIHQKGDPYLIGQQVHDYVNTFDGFDTPLEQSEAEDMAVSYAAYRLLMHRFSQSPNAKETRQQLVALMHTLGYDPYKTFSDYRGGDPAALGNFIANSIIEYGLMDGANENGAYENQYYHSVNESLVPTLSGNPSLNDPARWQPLQFDVFIDQAGNLTSGNTPAFLSPEWGSVLPFSLQEEMAHSYERDGGTYLVYHDPGAPPVLHSGQMSLSEWDAYKWNFTLVSIWSAQLDPYDGVMWDISPGALGNININDLPVKLEDYDQFYDLMAGGVEEHGRSVNPATAQPYVPQLVARGDYARVLAEFWADGPDSETPPGHWFVLLNYVLDQPDFRRKFKGQGHDLDPLEWDVKAYFALGGALHDAAIAAWGLKGWYDYIRPISAIRFMAEKGQSTDPGLPNYDPDGMRLVPGYVEQVAAADPLAGTSGENIGKVKLYAWRGHDYINNPDKDEAGVGWILAEDWWPYQRPSFVTPPFAGYVSGHSTYSRAAAEVLTRLTGSSFFPGGMGEFVARKNEFLVFEEGPSQDVVLQWATYQDASDQCSLSRIWGGIHPPADDIAGRLIGARVGADAFAYAEQYFKGKGASIAHMSKTYPVPADQVVYVTNTRQDQSFELYTLEGGEVSINKRSYNQITAITELLIPVADPGMYVLKSGSNSWKILLQ